LVVTVLPLDFHENLSWKVTDESILEAKKKASAYATNANRLNDKTPSVFVIKARYMSEEGYQKTKTLKKIKSADYQDNINNFLNEKSFESKVCHFCKEKGIDILNVNAITIALGNDGEPLVIEW
jgi:hypothetical protein